MNNSATAPVLLPAEWDDHQVILMAWPHADTDWAYMLEEAQRCYVDIIETITRYERVLLLAPDPAEPARLLGHIPADRLMLAAIPTNDTWTRDYGPITVASLECPEQKWALDFVFNGWGMKYAAALDNAVNRRLKACGILRQLRNRRTMVLEGGSVESNGDGVIMTTSQCLFEFNRNSGMPEAEILERLADVLGARVRSAADTPLVLEQTGGPLLVLDHGSVAGDDTDGHIDTLARFADRDTILYVSAPADLSHHDHAPLRAMERELHAKWRGRLVPLPYAGPVTDSADGSPLPATYANFLITPRAVIVPLYGLDTDSQALSTVGACLPGRDCVGVDCRALIRQHGSLHCATMQLYGSTLNLNSSSLTRI